MGRRLIEFSVGAGVGIAAYTWWRMRRRPTPAAAQLRGARQPGGEHEEEEEEAICAICLSTPELPCRTQCGHQFCTDCFINWWQRQPGALGGPTLGEARCPLCSQKVTWLRAEFSAARGDLRQLRAVVLYNWGAKVSSRLRRARKGLDILRHVGERTALASVALAGLVWEIACNELGDSLVPLPPPMDMKLRFFCMWQMLVTAFGHHLQLPVVGRMWASFLLTWLGTKDRDWRHALLVLDDAVSRADGIVRLCRGSILCRLGELVLRVSHPRLPEEARWLTPVLLRGLDMVGLVCDVAACLLSIHLECAGLRGLLVLLRWRRGQSPAIAIEPFEKLQFGVWPLELTTARFARVWTSRNRNHALPWAMCLDQYAVPLRAMRAFYDENFLRERLPDWALMDLFRLPPVA